MQKQQADRQLTQLIASLKKEVILSSMAKSSVRLLQEQIQHQYDVSESPKGVKFKNLKVPHGFPPVYGLRDAKTYQVIGNSIRVGSVKSYDKYHDTGTKKLPIRSPWAKETSEIPRLWKDRMAPYLDRQMQTYLLTGRWPAALPVEPPSHVRTTAGFLIGKK